MHPGPATTTANLSSAKFCILRRSHPLLHKSPNQSSVKIPNPPPRFFPICCASQNPSHSFTDQAPVKGSPDNLIFDNHDDHEQLQGDFKVQVGYPNVVSHVSLLPRLSLSDQAFLLLGFIGCTISVAFTGFVIAAVPTLHAMGKAAISFSKLADTAREELPSTMAAIRLSGMEISDLTLELTDLSQEISDGVNKSAQTVQAAEAGIRQIGSLARSQTMSMIQERANLPMISIKPVVAGAAKKTSEAVGHATKSFMSIISGGELSSGDGSVSHEADRLEM